ncbi:MAG: hypothetical protein JKY65_06525 [Planctomycetes bacterium]|nr:hypothetical protein [Planctomycetota bacterium]
MARIAVVLGPGSDAPEFDGLCREICAQGHQLNVMSRTSRDREFDAVLFLGSDTSRVLQRLRAGTRSSERAEVVLDSA